MPDHAAFLAAVCAHPEDDGPRLVYADWLDERGNPRGEFIRLQCELAGELPRTRQLPLLARSIQLLRMHRSAWRAPGVAEQTFHRGFVDDLTAPDTFALADLLSLFQQTPVRSLGIRGRPSFALDELVSRPEMGHLMRLDLGEILIGDEGAAALARSSQLSWLKRLCLRGPIGTTYRDRIHAVGAAELAQARSLDQLIGLDLDNNAIGDGGLASLAGSANFAALERLELADNEIGHAGDEAVERLCESPHLTRLRLLDLRGNPISRAGRRRLRERFGDAVRLPPD